ELFGPGERGVGEVAHHHVRKGDEREQRHGRHRHDVFQDERYPDLGLLGGCLIGGRWRRLGHVAAEEFCNPPNASVPRRFPHSVLTLSTPPSICAWAGPAWCRDIRANRKGNGTVRAAFSSCAPQ